MYRFLDIDVGRQFRVNVTSPVFLTTWLLPLLKNGREKKVVNIASFFGDAEWSLAHPELQNASYSVTKAAITMATIKFHNEWVNICPMCIRPLIDEKVPSGGLYIPCIEPGLGNNRHGRLIRTFMSEWLMKV